MRLTEQQPIPAVVLTFEGPDVAGLVRLSDTGDAFVRRGKAGGRYAFVPRENIDRIVEEVR